MMKYTVILILMVNLAERFCFYTITGTQLFFMKQSLNLTSSMANSVILVLQSACFLACLPGGILGDKLGKYKTILCLALIYLVGASMVSVSTFPSITSLPLFMIGSFGGLAIGSGGIKPNVPNFGADQVEKEDRQSFFSYFYMMINLGSAVALGFMPLLISNSESFGISQGWGYPISYAIATLAMGVALALFISGNFSYKGMQRTETVSLMRPLFRSLLYSSKSSVRGKFAIVGWAALIPFFIVAFIQAFTTGRTNQTFGIICGSLGLVLVVCLSYGHLDNSWIQLSPRVVSAVTQQEAQMTFQGIPMLLLSNCVFNFAYSMMLAPFMSQSCQMNLSLGNAQLSGTVFNLGDCLAVILFIPVWEKGVLPFIERRISRELKPMETLFGGFFFAALAMLSATFLELARRNADIMTPGGLMTQAQLDHVNVLQSEPWACQGGVCHLEGGSLMGLCKVNGVDYCSSCAPTFLDKTQNRMYGIYESNISAIYMFIPFALIGVGEILVNPTTQFYAYTLTPSKTRSVVQAANMVFQGAVPPAFVSVFTGLLGNIASPANLNDGHAEYVYYISLLVIFFGSVVFLYCAKAAESRMQKPEEDVQSVCMSNMQLSRSFLAEVEPAADETGRNLI
eukprot:TRINITY_DN20833_c0_g1_i1.p1 TRINITY_DN20833_c0_g1~~TRINITY_DN20833_c0_g1_i1.p1  ORF type:complete len:625 (+),score=74.99 TRINITY_DN20833_c0_g1_i1:82-1956(+)